MAKGIETMSRHLVTHTQTSTKGGLSRILLLIISLLFVISCGGDISVSAGKAKKKDSAAKEPASAEAASAVVADVPVQKDYVYTSIGKRDPFRSIFDEVGGEKEAIEEDTILSPLQDYDVESFIVTAIIWGISSPTAIVQAPDNETYVVRTGTLIGRNWGRVVKIKHNAIVILEQTLLSNSGEKVSNLIELPLPIETIKQKDEELNIAEEESEN